MSSLLKRFFTCVLISIFRLVIFKIYHLRIFITATISIIIPGQDKDMQGILSVPEFSSSRPPTTLCFVAAWGTLRSKMDEEPAARIWRPLSSMRGRQSSGLSLSGSAWCFHDQYCLSPAQVLVLPLLLLLRRRRRRSRRTTLSTSTRLLLLLPVQLQLRKIFLEVS